MKPLQLFVPITRSARTDDGASLFVEGYVYCNAVVGDGWNLKRAAMEAATPDYMNWGAVREMHQPSAAGTASGTVTVAGVEIPLGVEWDDKGAFLRTKIVDDNAIKKCEQGVYRGFSVGVQPTKVRGVDIEECAWYENSLVDRPYDKDANFSRMLLARRDDAPEDGSDVEVEVYEEDEKLPDEDKPDPLAAGIEGDGTPSRDAVFVVRGLFQNKVASSENRQLRGLAWEVLHSVFYEVLNHASVDDVDATVREAIGEFADYIVPLIVAERAKADEINATLPDELYWAAGMDDGATLVTRVAQITRVELDGRAELARVASELSARSVRVAELETRVAAQETEIARLKAAPDTKQARPVRVHGVALERTFADSIAPVAPEDAQIAVMRSDLDRLTRELSAEPDEKKRQDGVTRMLSLKQNLAALGASLS